MSDLDITPPPVPGKRKDGFLKRFFFKEDKEQQPDLDEIKRKLGLDEVPKAEEPIIPPDLDDIKRTLDLETPPAPSAPAKVEIHDWTADDAPAAAQATTSPSWTQEHAWHDTMPQQKSAAQSSPWSEELDITPDDLAADELKIDEPAGTPAHHDAVEQHLLPIAKEQEKVEKTLLLTDQRPEVPEWKLQEKEITPEQYFILRNGHPVRSLRELIDALDYIDDTTFAHHVNEYRNDFANWIRDVINDSTLADEVQQAETKPEMVKALLTHEREAAKQVQQEHAKATQVLKKREQTMKKLENVEDQITQLRKQLEQKTAELTNERKAKSALIKSKLDEEVNRRLETHKKALAAARQDLNSTKKEFLQKTKTVGEREHALGEREKALLLAEQRNHAMLETLKSERAQFMKEKKEERERLQAEKEEAKELLQDSAKLKRQWDEMKKLDLQTKQNMDAVTKRESALSRQEETLRQREERIASDLTKLHESQERYAQLKAEHDRREAEVKRMEALATATVAESQARAKEALDTERASRERIKEDLKKLEALRKHVDTALAKALKSKQKITTAVELRKHLEESVGKMRQDVASDRKAMEEESFKSYLETQRATTPAGQPDVSHADDVMEVGKRQLPIYAKVEECRQALDRHDLAAAKRLYTELREEFMAAKLPQSERSALYTSIRELYDDLHLAMLG